MYITVPKAKETENEEINLGYNDCKREHSL
jgi:hypothetical protein